MKRRSFFQRLFGGIAGAAIAERAEAKKYRVDIDMKDDPLRTTYISHDKPSRSVCMWPMTGENGVYTLVLSNSYLRHGDWIAPFRARNYQCRVISEYSNSHYTKTSPYGTQGDVYRVEYRTGNEADGFPKEYMGEGEEWVKLFSASIKVV